MGPPVVEKKQIAGDENQGARGTGGLIACRLCMIGSGEDRRKESRRMRKCRREPVE